jgi:uncharacterized Zn-binding protein involved in type VI secretion
MSAPSWNGWDGPEMALDPNAVGGVITRGGNAAHTAQSPAGGPNPLDVWTHTGEGFGQQGATSSMDLSHIGSTPVGDVPGAMKMQAGSLVEALKAVKDADGALATTGAVFGALTSAEQLISIPFSAIPFPALPAVRILDFAIGLPHAHSHPPNLIPPAPPIPLPSFGPVIPIPFLSGAGTVLINGMPAGRCLDMGLGIWCGGYFPMFEIFLGSSSVWIEGMRAARIGVDITKHCVFSSFKVGPSDPPLGVPIGTTVTASPNVIIGGVPMPSLMAMALGAAMKGAFKGLGKLGRLSLRAEKGAAATPLYRKGRAPALTRTGPVNFRQLRDVLAQAGQKPGRFNFQYVPARDAPGGGYAYGWVGQIENGIQLDDLGRPIIYFTDMGLSSLQQAVITFGHELKHIEDIMIKGARDSSHAHAEKAGQELWAKVVSILKRPRK